MDHFAQVWESRTVAAGDVELFVRDTGSRDAPAIVLLHGLGGHAGEWWPVASLLHDVFRIVAFDQRGQGRSAHSDDFSREVFVRDTVSVISGLGGGPVILVGHSMGAHTALLTASAHPELVNSLVLLEGGLGGEGSVATEAAINWFHQWPTPFLTRAAAQAWFEEIGLTPTAACAWASGLREDARGFVPRFALENLRAQLLAVHSHRRQEEWIAITCPTLVMTASNGFIAPDEVNGMLATNPHASALEVPGAGHDVHLDAPEEVARHIRQHLRG